LLLAAKTAQIPADNIEQLVLAVVHMRGHVQLSRTQHFHDCQLAIGIRAGRLDDEPGTTKVINGPFIGVTNDEGDLGHSMCSAQRHPACQLSGVCSVRLSGNLTAKASWVWLMSTTT
jgi:hypothetical protein